jgi:hypothetical protein
MPDVSRSEAPANVMNSRSHRIAAIFFLTAATLGAADKHVHLLPRLQPGQILYYLIRLQSDKNVKTQSRVAAPMAPNAAQLDAHGLLRIEILDVQQAANKSTIHASGRFLSLDSGVWVKNPGDKKPNWDAQRLDSNGKTIEFTISPDGSINDVKNLDSLFPEQQQAWQQWVARFALAWTLPDDGVKCREKWKSDESERSGSPIAGLQWSRDSSYVKDEPCQPRQLSVEGEVVASTVPPDLCAVLLTNSTLKQKSSTKDATPEDFKLHDLRTMGTAKGSSEIITYISLRSGLVVRATEETTQTMDVLVAKADGSNRVQYHVDAKSHAEVLLITETLLNQP